MVKIVKGDLLKADVDIICHQSNCLGIFGSGLALEVKKKYYEVFLEYHTLCIEKNPDELLGTCQMVNCKDGNYVANLFGQLRYGLDKRHTDYVALESALRTLRTNAEDYNLSVGIPYLLGCGTGGGDWSVVYGIINRVFEGYENVTIYDVN